MGKVARIRKHFRPPTFNDQLWIPEISLTSKRDSNVPFEFANKCCFTVASVNRALYEIKRVSAAATRTARSSRDRDIFGCRIASAIVISRAPVEADPRQIQNTAAHGWPPKTQVFGAPMPRLR